MRKQKILDWLEHPEAELANLREERERRERLEGARPQTAGPLSPPRVTADRTDHAGARSTRSKRVLTLPDTETRA